jgi:hypothetical protein
MTTKKLLGSLALLALIGYSVFATVQLKRLQTRVTALEQSQSNVAHLQQSVRALEQEWKNPRPRFLGKN